MALRWLIAGVPLRGSSHLQALVSTGILLAFQ